MERQTRLLLWLSRKVGREAGKEKADPEAGKREGGWEKTKDYNAKDTAPSGLLIKEYA